MMRCKMRGNWTCFGLSICFILLLVSKTGHGQGDCLDDFEGLTHRCSCIDHPDEEDFDVQIRCVNLDEDDGFPEIVQGENTNHRVELIIENDGNSGGGKFLGGIPPLALDYLSRRKLKLMLQGQADDILFTGDWMSGMFSGIQGSVELEIYAEYVFIADIQANIVSVGFQHKLAFQITMAEIVTIAPFVFTLAVGGLSKFTLSSCSIGSIGPGIVFLETEVDEFEVRGVTMTGTFAGLDLGGVKKVNDKYIVEDNTAISIPTNFFPQEFGDLETRPEFKSNTLDALPVGIEIPEASADGSLKWHTDQNFFTVCDNSTVCWMYEEPGSEVVEQFRDSFICMSPSEFRGVELEEYAPHGVEFGCAGQMDLRANIMRTILLVVMSMAIIAKFK